MDYAEETPILSEESIIKVPSFSRVGFGGLGTSLRQLVCLSDQHIYIVAHPWDNLCYLLGLVPFLVIAAEVFRGLIELVASEWPKDWTDRDFIEAAPYKILFADISDMAIRVKHPWHVKIVSALSRVPVAEMFCFSVPPVKIMLRAHAGKKVRPRKLCFYNEQDALQVVAIIQERNALCNLRAVSRESIWQLPLTVPLNTCLALLWIPLMLWATYGMVTGGMSWKWSLVAVLWFPAIFKLIKKLLDRE